MGAIKCLPPCHMTYLASCQNSPCQLPLLHPSPQADSISLAISTNAPSHSKRYPLQSASLTSFIQYLASLSYTSLTQMQSDFTREPARNPCSSRHLSNSCLFFAVIILPWLPVAVLRFLTDYYRSSFPYQEPTRTQCCEKYSKNNEDSSCM